MPTSIPYRSASVANGSVYRDTITADGLWDPVVLVAIAMVLFVVAVQFDADALWPLPALMGP